MTSIELTESLTQTPNVFQVDAKNLTQTLIQSTELYEVTFHNDKKCRAYIDIDGKMSLDTDELDFTMKNDAILQALSDCEFGTPFSICTSSKYNNNNWNTTKKCTDKITHKLSYNLVFYERFGTKDAVKQWIEQNICPVLKRELSEIIPFFTSAKEQGDTRYDYLDYDNGVYRSNGKMRALGSTKPNENRPKVIYGKATSLDTMITYVPEGCQEIITKKPQEKVVTKQVALKPCATVETTTNTLTQVVDGLGLHRWNNYNDFIHIGMACYNEKLPLEVWERNAKKGHKNQPGDCIQHWNKFKEGGYTAKTLWKMLKEDNPLLFKELLPMRSDIEQLLSEFTHYNVAQMFFNHFPNDYLIDNSGWWSVLNTNIWAYSGKVFPATLRLDLARAIYSDLLEQEKIYLKQQTVLNDSNDNNIKEKLKGITDKLENLNKCKAKIQTASFTKDVISFIQGFYTVETLNLLQRTEHKNVLELMDGNPNLWAFKDSVYELNQINGITIGNRALEKTDYVSKHCGYSYPKSNSSTRQEIESLLMSMFNTKGLSDYILTLLGTAICGVRNSEGYFIFTGSGRNGKGLLFELLINVFGQYYYNLPVSVLTSSVSTVSTSPTPLLAGMAGKRLICSTEPEANVKLEEGTIKAFTGGDPVTARFLNQDPFTFKPQAMFCLQCNVRPLLNGITPGGAQRIRVIPFPNVYVNNPILPNERKGDPNVKNVLCKSTNWRDEMCLMLLEYFELGRGKAIDALITPIEVQEASAEYIQENNKIGEWWFNNYEKCAGSIVLSQDGLRDYNTETNRTINDRTFKNGMAFNDIFIVKIYQRGENYNKHAIVNWRRKATL
jgi:P4 family phage/plasmid primase-like protien